MNEEFLHFIWKTQQFNHHNLNVQSGEALQILRAGTLNQDAGPDFFNGQIVLAETRWAGNIEIHVKASDWLLHKHDDDPNYSNIILHVVWEEDLLLFFKNGTRIPTLELKGKVPRSLKRKYENLGPLFQFIPCERELGRHATTVDTDFFFNLLKERLIERREYFTKIFELNKGDWEKTFAHVLFQAFGFRLNTIPMELLFQTTDYKVLRKCGQSIELLESLLFGQAGFLEDELEDDYFLELKDEYNFLSNKYKLIGLKMEQWKFLRTRPGNFPTIRIAQLASVLFQHPSIFNQLISFSDLKDTYALLDLPVQDYWRKHYHFSKVKKKPDSGRIGKQSINLLLINAVLPFKYFYFDKCGLAQAKAKVLKDYLKLPAETNSTINNYEKLGFLIGSSMHSQALLQLNKKYCKLKKCLTCSLGNSLLKVQNNDE